MNFILGLIVLAWTFFIAHFVEFMLVFILITLNGISRALHGIWTMMPKQDLGFDDAIKNIQRDINDIKSSAQRTAEIAYRQTPEYHQRVLDNELNSPYKP